MQDTKAVPFVAVVIVHYKGRGELYNCIQSVLRTNYENFKIFLVDNGSTDGSVDAVRNQKFDKLAIIESERNLGFIGGNNLALSQMKADYVVLLNDDTIVDPEWLSPMVEICENQPKIAGCQPKLLSLRDPGYFEYNGACGGMLDVFGVPLTRGRLFDLAEKDRHQYDTQVEVFWPSGAAMFLRMDVLLEVGFLDDLLYAHMEEIDLAWRMRLRGYKFLAVPESIVYHLGGNTSMPSKMYLKQRNNVILMLKNFGRGSLIKFLPARVLFDLFTVPYFLKRRDMLRVWGILKAYGWIVSNLRAVLASRRKVQSLRTVQESEILNAMLKASSAIQFYLLKRRRFSQLSHLPLPLERYVRTEEAKQSGHTVLIEVSV